MTKSLRKHDIFNFINSDHFEPQVGLMLRPSNAPLAMLHPILRCVCMLT